MYNSKLSTFFFFFLSFLGPYPWHMEVPRLGVKSELLLLAHARATATPDPSHICDLHHGSRQRWILNSLSKARVRIHNLMVPSRICFCCTTTGTPSMSLLTNETFLFIKNIITTVKRKSNKLFDIKYTIDFQIYLNVLGILINICLNPDPNKSIQTLHLFFTRLLNLF